MKITVTNTTVEVFWFNVSSCSLIVYYRWFVAHVYFYTFCTLIQLAQFLFYFHTVFPVSYGCDMVNKCCLHYCKSGANCFAFPNVETHRELREKWITFVSQVNFEPSPHSRICIDHFDQKFIKYGARNHLKWDMMPIPTIHTNDEHDKSISPSSLSVPKTPRKGPRKRIFQEDQLGSFREKDTIRDFDALSESNCLPSFTFIKEKDIVLMYRLVIDQKTKIPVVHESISIDKNLHVSLSY